MLAIAATDRLFLADPALLKRSQVILPADGFTSTPIASTWAPDNSALFIASQREINKYDPAGNFVQQVYDNSDSEEHIGPCLISKDKGNTLVFAIANKLHILECGDGGKPLQTLETHKSPITSLAVSNDSVILASTSRTSIHIHNLSLSTQAHTVLRGFAPSSGPTTCKFSPHLRTRLLVGSGHTLYIYDTSRPAGPLKTIPIRDVASGDIVAVSCSPFSKTLVAAACSSGAVGLVDLDKEKGFVDIYTNLLKANPPFSDYSRPLTWVYL